MNESLGQYNPGNVNVIINERTISGFAEDEMVRVERDDENEASVKTGAQGDYTFQINLNKSGKIVITLKQNAPDNIFLQSLKEAKSLFAVRVEHRGSYKEIATGTDCMIGIAPRKIMGKEESDREWQIAVGNIIETDKAL